jgi:hypothetical protein
VIEKMPESTADALGFRAIGDVTKDDYGVLFREVQAAIDQAETIGVLIDLERFEGEKPGAWLADLEFGHAYHKKIARMAIVGDKRWEHVIAVLADPFYARESKAFGTAERELAWAWVRGT